MARKRRRKALSPRQRRQRAQDRNPLYNPAAVLSGHHLASAVNTLADLQVRPQLSALDRESKTASVQGAALSKGAGDYYHQLAQQEAGTVDRMAALTARTRGQLQTIAGDSQAQQTQAEGADKSRQTVDAATRGAGLSGGTGAQAALAAMRARGAQSAQAFRSTGELQGANYEGLAISNRSARGLRGGEIQGQLANRLATKLGDIRTKRSDVEASRGGVATKLLTDLRQSGFENLITAKSLGVKEADLAAKVANQKSTLDLAGRRQSEVERANRADERVANINAQLKGGSLTETQRHNLQTEKVGLINANKKGSGSSGAGSLTPTQVRKYRSQYTSAVAKIQSDPKWSPKKAKAFVRALVASGVEQDIAIAAVQRVRDGRVHGDVAKRVKGSYGFRTHTKKKKRGIPIPGLVSP